MAFFGTPEFAVPSLEALLAGPHETVAVVSQPDRKRGRGRRASPSPISEVALREGRPLLRPQRVGDPEVVTELTALAPDLGVVVAFGQFLPKHDRELPSLGYLINGHASLLPRHRGAAPIQRAILAGDPVTGVSIMRVERRMDAGPVALTRQTPIRANENAGELAARIAALTAEAVMEVLDSIAAGTEEWTPQDDDDATEAPKIGREDGRLDWSLTAEALARRVRALAPAPGAFGLLDGETLRILAARSIDDPVDAPPGTVRAASGALRIATGRGWLVPDRLQRPGGRSLDTAAFLRGRDIPDGSTLD
ncbi:MAG: methionyl-tRNA formyltransferase [Myxococcota bacterium]